MMTAYTRAGDVHTHKLAKTNAKLSKQNEHKAKQNAQSKAKKLKSTRKQTRNTQTTQHAGFRALGDFRGQFGGGARRSHQPGSHHQWHRWCCRCRRRRRRRTRCRCAGAGAGSRPGSGQFRPAVQPCAPACQVQCSAAQAPPWRML